MDAPSTTLEGGHLTMNSLPSIPLETTYAGTMHSPAVPCYYLQMVGEKFRCSHPKMICRDLGTASGRNNLCPIDDFCLGRYSRLPLGRGW